MTLLEIKTAAAAYHKKTVSDLIVNDIDLGLIAINEARLAAELLHDFSFQRKLLTLTVNTATGGSLEDAEDEDGNTVTIKTIVDVGQVDTYGNFRPIEWTTAEESHTRSREENPYGGIRYPTDGEYVSGMTGQRRVMIRGDKVTLYPTTAETSSNVTIYIEAYVFSDSWRNADRITVTDSPTPTPDVTGTFTEDGEAGGFSLYYADNDSGYFIYYDGTQWIITDNELDASNKFYLVRSGASADGTYAADGTYSGSPTLVTSSSVVTPTNSDIWTQQASQYLLWQSVIELNKYFKTFVPRTEGNLTEPQVLADAGLQAFITADIYKVEGFRRHGR